MYKNEKEKWKTKNKINKLKKNQKPGKKKKDR